MDRILMTISLSILTISAMIVLSFFVAGNTEILTWPPVARFILVFLIIVAIGFLIGFRHN